MQFFLHRLTSIAATDICLPLGVMVAATYSEGLKIMVNSELTDNKEQALVQILVHLV